MEQILLAVDTTTEQCGVSIVAQNQVVVALRLNHGETHSRHVLKAIDSALSLGGITLSGIDAFAVTIGPGSFTGLRIGISTVKGLSFASGKPVVGLSSLETLAHQASGNSKLICPMLDARRNEIYWRIYKRQSGLLIPQTHEQVGPVDHLIRQISAPCIFIGSGAMLYGDRLAQLCKHDCQFVPMADNPIRPAVMAELAWQYYHQGKFVDARSIQPVYLRQSDAELNHQRNQ